MPMSQLPSQPHIFLSFEEMSVLGHKKNVFGGVSDPMRVRFQPITNLPNGFFFLIIGKCTSDALWGTDKFLLRHQRKNSYVPSSAGKGCEKLRPSSTAEMTWSNDWREKYQWWLNGCRCGKCKTGSKFSSTKRKNTNRVSFSIQGEELFLIMWWANPVHQTLQFPLV